MKYSACEKQLCKKIYGRILTQEKDGKFFGNVAKFISVFGTTLTNKNCLHDK
jgi:hypothetical protein